MPSPSPWEEKLARAKTLWKYRDPGPHAAYTLSDRHADFYFNSDAFASDPALVNAAADDLIVRLRKTGITGKAFWIVSYSGAVSASLVLASVVSQKLNKRLAYMDIRTDAINFPIKDGDAALIVTDDIYTGGSIRKIVNILSDRKVEILAPILTVANFFGAGQLDDLKIMSLIDRTLETWPSASCPLCQAGSQAIPARKEWPKLFSVT
jgi:hypothetical protein